MATACTARTHAHTWNLGVFFPVVLMLGLFCIQVSSQPGFLPTVTPQLSPSLTPASVLSFLSLDLFPCKGVPFQLQLQPAKTSYCSCSDYGCWPTSAAFQCTLCKWVTRTGVNSSGWSSEPWPLTHHSGFNTKIHMKVLTFIFANKTPATVLGQLL